MVGGLSLLVVEDLPGLDATRTQVVSNPADRRRRPPPAPSSVEPAGGDWKYVSDIKDATLSPSRYPRELRRSERRPGEDAHQYRMYPYDKSYKTGNGAALPQHIPNSGKPPRIRNSYPPRQQEPLQRY
ncbi:hypothetical protein BV898_19017 [Hypsibius exemplaris]|uniref:Uncharacterized protein n=1 Tax=Hypsibius exemplaris TaxID=2072580 RepID=A0A9X6RNQ0_HYPEX|nr:hypothetical protein BV898_19017 [Hypsibius exemplaris]